MKTILALIVMGGIGFAAGVFLGPRWMDGRGAPLVFRADDTAEARRDGPTRAPLDSVHALGRVEPDGGLYPVGAPAGARLEQILVTLGQEVREGDKLGLVEGYAERTAQVALIEAQLEEARQQRQAEQAYAAILDQEAALEKTSLAMLEVPERKIQASNINLLAEKAKSSQIDYDHLVELSKDRRATISAQELERQHLIMRQDEAMLQSARIELEKYDASLKSRRANLELQLKKSKAASQRGSQAIPVKSLEMQLALVREQVKQTEIRAPRDGRILAILTKPGEVAGPKPVFELGDTRRMYVVAEVDEAQIALIRKGQKATIEAYSTSRPYTGVVESWALMVAKNDILGLDPTAAAYARVVEIKIKVGEPCDELRDRTHMQVNVDIDLEDSAESKSEPEPRALGSSK